MSSDQILSTNSTETFKMSLEQITTCVDENDRVIGLQFQLASALMEGDLTLPSIGTIDGTCDAKIFYGASIEKIQASQSQSIVSAIHFSNYESQTLPYGTLNPDNTKEWIFTDELELIGLYG